MLQESRGVARYLGRQREREGSVGGRVRGSWQHELQLVLFWCQVSVGSRQGPALWVTAISPSHAQKCDICGGFSSSN